MTRSTNALCAAWLASCVALWMALPGAASAGDTAATSAAASVHLQPLAAGQTQTTLVFEVQPDPDGSTLNLQFSLPPALRGARLIGPDGRAQPLTEPARMRRLNAAERQRPELGELFLPQALDDPAPGRWRLEIDHAPARAGQRVLWSAHQVPALAARLERLPSVLPLVGNEQVLLLRATRRGLLAAGHAPTLAVQGPDGRSQVLPMAEARAERVPLAQDSGVYVARWTPAAPGSYRLVGQIALDAPQGRRVERRHAVDVQAEPRPAGSSAPLQLERREGPGGCWQALIFTRAWTADAPGSYTLSIRLEGRERELRVNGSIETQAPGPLMLRAELPAAKAATLAEAPQTRALGLQVLHTREGFRVVDSQSAQALPQPVDPARACR